MTSPKSRDQHNASSNQRLLKSLGCISSIGLLGSSSLLTGIALAEESLVDSPGDGETPALVDDQFAEVPPAPPLPIEITPLPMPQLIAEAALGVAPAVAFEPVADPVVAVEPIDAFAPVSEPVIEAPVYEEPYVEPYVEDYSEPVYEAPYEESYSEPAYTESYTPEPYTSEAESLPAPDLQAPVVELTPADLAPPSQETFANDTGSDLNAGGSGAVIDTSDLYSTGATSTENVQQLEQPAVVITEREPASCDQMLQADGISCGDAPVLATPTPDAGYVENGETIAPPPSQQVAGAEDVQGESGLPTVTLSPGIVSNATSGDATFASPASRKAALPSPTVAATTQVTGNVSSSNGYSVTVPSNLQNPLSFAVQSLGRSFSQSMDAASYYARTQRPTAIPGNGDRSLLYPLSVPSPVSSVFGWRMHPIHNTWRFHSGTDFAAEQGTPIVAPLSGIVALADFVGGYGLTVTIDHTGGKTQTLFGHMSEIFVRPGQYVRQGEVVGRVGNTGHSTGPHLHFEVRQQDAQGSWVAVDPGRYLEGSLAQLMQVLRNEPLQLSPIPIAQSPFKIQPSLSTGLLPLLQQQPQMQTPAQAQQQQIALNPSTPLERAVVQVVKSLEGQPSQRLQARQVGARRVVSQGAAQNGWQPGIAAPSAPAQPISSAFPQVPSGQLQQPVPLQQPQKLSQLHLEHDHEH